SLIERDLATGKILERIVFFHVAYRHGRCPLVDMLDLEPGHGSARPMDRTTVLVAKRRACSRRCILTTVDLHVGCMPSPSRQHFRHSRSHVANDPLALGPRQVASASPSAAGRMRTAVVSIVVGSMYDECGHGSQGDEPCDKLWA